MPSPYTGKMFMIPREEDALVSQDDSSDKAVPPADPQVPFKKSTGTSVSAMINARNS